MGANIFIWRIQYGRFHRRFFEKMGSAFFFLIASNLFFTIISYYIPWFGYFFAGLLSVICILEIAFYFEYQSLFTSNTFLVLAETNAEESKEFLHDLCSWRLFKNIFLTTMGFVVLPALLSPVFFMTWRTQIGKDSILFLMFASILNFLQAQRPKKRERYYIYFPLVRLWREYVAARKQMKENLQALGIQEKVEKGLPFFQLKRDVVDTLIFVIGESASRNYLEIYDSFASYLKNSPYMIERQRKGELFAFDNVISAESLTAFSIPKMMTFKNFEKEKEWYHYPSMISVLKKAGYRTYWISNQMKNETVGRVFSSLTDSSFFSEDLPKTNTGEEQYGEVLLTEGLKMIGKEAKKAIFFHIQGSHNTYSKRYPSEWNIDRIETILGNQSQKKKKYIAEYSNSLRYTDYILEKIFLIFSQEKTLLFYTSDHSEELWEERDFRGHTGEKGSRYMIEIPMFILLSKKLQESSPELVEACKKSIHKPYMTDDIIHTVLGTLDVQIEEYEEKRNILSENFDRSHKRLYQGEDYDIFWKHQYDRKGE